jgi:arginase
LIVKITADFLFTRKGEVIVEDQNTSLTDNEKIFAFVGVPTWYGAGKLGTEYGPAVLKEFCLEDKLREQGVKNIGWCQVEPEKVKSKESKCGAMKYASEICYTQKNVFRMVKGLLMQGYKPIVVGGDHTISIGSVSAHSIFSGAARKIGVIWIDAHLDAHTPETSPSGNVHGMPLAVLLGHGSDMFTYIGGEFRTKVYAKNVVHIGANSMEEAEERFFAEQRVQFFPKKKIDTDEGFTEMLTAIADLSSRVETIILSIDLDGFDKKDAPGVHLRNRKGISREQARTIFTHIKTNCPNIGGIDIAEIVQRKDKENKTVLLVYDILTWLLVP